MCKRGYIYLVDLRRNKNTNKQYGIRPVVIVSNNRANTYSPIIIVVPLISKIDKKRFQPTHVFIPTSAGYGLTRGSLALAEQVEAIDKDSLLEKKGMIISEAIMDKITIAFQIQIGVYEEYN